MCFRWWYAFAVWETYGSLNGAGVFGAIGEGDFVAAVVLVGDGRVRHHLLSEMVCLRVGQQDVLPAVELLMLVRDVEGLEVVGWERVLLAEHDRCYQSAQKPLELTNAVTDAR